MNLQADLVASNDAIIRPKPVAHHRANKNGAGQTAA